MVPQLKDKAGQPNNVRGLIFVRGKMAGQEQLEYDLPHIQALSGNPRTLAGPPGRSAPQEPGNVDRPDKRMFTFFFMQKKSALVNPQLIVHSWPAM